MKLTLTPTRRVPSKVPASKLGLTPEANLLPKSLQEQRERGLAFRAAAGMVLTTATVLGIALGGLWLHHSTLSAELAAVEAAGPVTPPEGAAESMRLANEVQRLTSALESAQTGRVIWADVFDAVSGALPAGAAMTSLDVTAGAPADSGDGALQSDSATPTNQGCQGTSGYNVTVAISAPSAGALAEFVDAIEAGESFSCANVNDVNADSAGSQYQTTVVLGLNAPQPTNLDEAEES